MSSITNSTTRVTSLYSGLDTDALVTNALSTQQAKLDKIFQNKEKASWRLEAYSEISKQVSTLRSNYLSTLGSGSVIKNATYNAFTSSITSNSAVSVSAGESALPTSFSIKSVTLASAAGASAASQATSNAKAWGSGKLTIPEGKTLATTTIGELKSAFGLSDGESLSIGINGTTYSFDQNTTMAELQTQLSTKAGVTLSFNEAASANEDGTTTVSFSMAMQNGGTMKLSNVSGTAFGSSGVFGIDEGTHYAAIKRSDTIADALRKNGASEEQITAIATNGITLNGKTFTFDPETDTLRSMMTTINNDDDANAVFSYSELTGKFSISSAETGAASALSITDTNGYNGLAAFGLSSVSAGSDALVTLSDGTQITESSNSFTRDGITFTLTDNYTATDDTGLRVSVEQDFSGTVSAIKQFVTDYNSLIEKLNTYYTEETYSKYDPLTEEQRDDLTEKEAEKWDEKAKSGILRNDSTIGDLLSDLRKSLSVKTKSTGLSVMDLGISTTSWDSGSWKTEQGKLTLDEDKLTQMLKENPSAVQDTFTAVAQTKETTGSGYSTVSNEGFFTRMSSSLSSFSATMRNDKISGTTTAVYNYEVDYTDMLEKYYDKQEALYQKYAAMETALSKLQSQSNELSSMLGTSSSS